MPNVSAKLRVLGVVKLLNAVSSVVIILLSIIMYYRCGCFLRLDYLSVVGYLHNIIGGNIYNYYSIPA